MIEPTYKLSIEEAETIVSFVKSHERDEIGDEMWELSNKLFDFVFDNCL